MRRDVAAANHLKTMSDFGRWVAGGGKVMLACSAEFANAGTLRSLEQTYGFTLRSDQLIVLAGGETSATIGAAAARTNGTNTAMVYGTDGGIEAARPAGAGGRSARSAGVCAGAGDSRVGAQGATRRSRGWSGR